jgi:thiol-disulfide isomerase/thioredoxin
MNWLGALLAAVALVAVAVAIGVAARSMSGRVRRQRPTSAGAVSSDSPTVADALGISEHELGRRATLVQFSTEFCSRCPGTARQLSDISSEYEGVRHIEVDVTNRADLADRFRILQTPTTLILGADGTATARIGGAPRGGELRDQLDRLTRSDRVPR